MQTRLIRVALGVLPLVFAACRAPATGRPTAPAGLDAAGIAAFERRIERAQVDKDVTFLDAATDPSLRFTHGGGTNVQSKEEWLRGITGGTMYDRQVSEQQVELHGDIAVTTGQIQVRRPARDSARANYTIWYVRVYRCERGGCQLLSHVTTRSTLLPSPAPAPPNER